MVGVPTKEQLNDKNQDVVQWDRSSYRTTGVAGPNSDVDLEIGKGNIPGYGWVFITGNNSNVDTNDTVIREAGGSSYPFPLTATQWFLQSDSVNDDVGGTGARSVVHFLLDVNYDEVIEVVNLEGTASVQLLTEALRINTFAVATAGSLFTNDGIITLTTLTGGAGDLLNSISAGDSSGRQAVMTVPAGTTWFALTFTATAGEGDDIEFRAVAASPGPVPGRVLSVVSKNFVSQTVFSFINSTRIQFPEKFDLLVLAKKSSGAVGGRVTVVFEFQSVVNANF